MPNTTDAKAWLGLDVGGANIKAADSTGWAQSRPFPLWRDPGGLSEALRALLQAVPRADHVALSMTGELADCFATKADGVRHIIEATREAIGPRSLDVYVAESGSNAGRFVDPVTASANPLGAAASNWHALAAFVGQVFEIERGLLIDLGSTTCDFVSIQGRRSCATGRTDHERLLSGELLYLGVARTPICAVTDHLLWRENEYPIAAELFATTLDAYLVLGKIPEEPENASTADGRPATKEYAVDRLARMFCADRTTFTVHDARRAAELVCRRQAERLLAALDAKLPASMDDRFAIVVSGQGEFLLREILAERGFACRILSLSDRLGPIVSECAPAYAVAMLAANQWT